MANTDKQCHQKKIFRVFIKLKRRSILLDILTRTFRRLGSKTLEKRH